MPCSNVLELRTAIASSTFALRDPEASSRCSNSLLSICSSISVEREGWREMEIGGGREKRKEGGEEEEGRDGEGARKKGREGERER